MSRAWCVGVGVAGVAAFVLALAAGLSGAASRPGAVEVASAGRAAREIPVSDPASFARALSSARPGDTIRLADGTYPVLAVSGRRYAGKVTIAGSRAAHLAGLTVSGSTNVVVSGVTVTPPGSQRATVQVAGSSNITLDGLLVDGRTETAGAWIVTDPTDSQVTVSNSEITNCGATGRCIGPGARGLQILHDNFHDCLDCDFIRGQAGGQTTIADSTFDRAVPGPCGCNHNDIIQTLGGGPWTIVRNRFGEQLKGGAPVFVTTSTNNRTNRVHDVTVASNLFISGTSGYFAVSITEGGIPGPPLNVSVVNNTILTGSTAAVRLGPPWAGVPRDQQPLVANNIFARSTTNGLCAEARTGHNLVESGQACPGDVVGPANLDANGAPTKASTLVIDKADPAFAPATDLYGHPTGKAPDIGAIEYGQFVQPLELSAPSSVLVSRSWLRKHGWKVSVQLKFTGVTALRMRVLLRYKPVLTRTATVRGAAARPSFVVPVAARSASRLRVEFRGTSADGRTLVRTTILHLAA
jgi:Right handed beta helix region